MFTVALIGADGAGKSTISQKLQVSFPLPIKYLYMGVNPASSNFSLPTTRLFRFVSLRRKKYFPKQGEFNDPIQRVSGKRKKKRFRNLRAILRISVFLSEEYYRQFISWIYQMRGYIVLFDRHFTFDYDVNIVDKDRALTFADHFHRWILLHFFPRPDLVIFLDAPPEVLFARKGEGTLNYLESRRKSFLEQGKQTPNFFTVDTTNSIEKVVEQVSEHILSFYKSHGGKSLNSGLKNLR